MNDIMTHMPHGCCEGELWSLEANIRWQALADLMIALAYFSIPLELVYFVTCLHTLPFRGVVLQFVAFIVLCGITHFLAILTESYHTSGLLLTQTTMKILTALVSCYTAATLFRVIPELLRVKVREQFLKDKTRELDREMDIMRKREETGRNLRILTEGIRSTIDRYSILNMSLFELSKALGLNNCTIWIPNPVGDAMELTHELERRPVQEPFVVPMADPVVQTVLSTTGAVQIWDDCALGKASSHEVMPGKLAAVRLPMQLISDFKLRTASYAIMVLLLPREWSQHELELVEVVADQVAVALSHAVVLEESMHIRDKLAQQNKLLEEARLKAATAMRAKSNFLSVMDHEMRTPMHVVIALSSVLQEDVVDLEQKSTVNAILKSSSLLSSMLKDMVEFARLEDASLTPGSAPLELHSVIKQAISLVKLVAKDNSVVVDIAQDVPSQVISDEKRLMQILLNVVGNAAKLISEGPIHIKVTLYSPDQAEVEWVPSSCEGTTYLTFQVNRPGLGLFRNRVPHQMGDEAASNTQSLRIAICKKIAQLLQGHFWISKDGSATFIIQVRLQDSRRSPPYVTDLRGLRILVVDDNNVNRLVTKRLLVKLGCKATVAEAGLQSLSTVSQMDQSYDILLLDLAMPVMDGYEVVMQIDKSFNPEDRPLVLALTAYSDKGTRQRCLRAGIDHIVSKPVSLEELRVILCRLLRKFPQSRFRRLIRTSGGR